MDPSGAGSIDAWMDDVGREFVDNQSALGQFKSKVIAIPGIYESGYIESVNDSSNRSATLLWKGASPLRDKVREMAVEDGISVQFEERRYSRAEVEAAMAAIWQNVRSESWQGFKVASVEGPDTAYDGITVTGAFDETAPTDPDSLQKAERYARGLIGSNIDLKLVGDRNISLWYGRMNDWGHFHAGGYMIDGSGGWVCSSGFGIWLNGVARTTTARHCDKNTYHSRDANGPANQYGVSIATVPVAAGRVLSGTGTQYSWDGQWNTQDYSKRVTGFFDLSLGDLVCTSGGNTGVHCNVKIENMWVMQSDQWGAFPTIKGKQQTAGQIAGGAGDSGGPVIVPYSDGTTIGAAGMIQGGDSPPYYCGSVRDYIQCNPTVYFSSMRTFINNLPGSGLRT